MKTCAYYLGRLYLKEENICLLHKSCNNKICHLMPWMSNVANHINITKGKKTCFLAIRNNSWDVGHNILGFYMGLFLKDCASIKDYCIFVRFTVILNISYTLF